MVVGGPRRGPRVTGSSRVVGHVDGAAVAVRARGDRPLASSRSRPVPDRRGVRVVWLLASRIVIAPGVYTGEAGASRAAMAAVSVAARSPRAGLGSSRCSRGPRADHAHPGSVIAGGGGGTGPSWSATDPLHDRLGGRWVIASRDRATRALRRRAAHLEAERESLAREAVAEERGRIARELHDVVAHSVSVMTVQAGGVRRLLRRRADAGARSAGRDRGDRPPGPDRDAADGGRHAQRRRRGGPRAAARARRTSTDSLTRCVRRASRSTLNVEGTPARCRPGST